MLKEIYNRLGIETDLKQEKERFKNRIISSLNELQDICVDPTFRIRDYFGIILNEVNFKLGKLHKIAFRHFIQDEYFERILIVCEVFLSVLFEVDKHLYEKFRDRVKHAAEDSVLDLGIIFKEDKFYQKGAKELDKSLILEPLDWIKDFSNAKEFFHGALNEYLEKDYPDAITKAYSSIESLVETILDSNKKLDALIPALLKKLNLPNEWKAILTHYCKYAHEFASRHGKKEGRKMKQLDPINVEAYIYMTGLIIRLIIQDIKSRAHH